MEIILNSQFPQAHLLDARRFSEFLTKRGVRISEEDLEYFDEKGVIRPALRLHRPRASEGPMKYGTLFTDIYSIQQMYKEGGVELPKDNDFQPWENYKDGYEEKTWLYYHPFQFVPVRRLIGHNRFNFSADYFEKLQDVQKSFEMMKKHAERSLAVAQKVAVESWIPRVGLLMLLEEPYYPLLGSLSMNIYEEDSFDKWREWRVNKFSPHELLSRHGFTVEQAKELYDIAASEGHIVDPNAHWYPLLKLIKTSKKERLQDKALLAQNYYNLATMVAHFVYDLTKEKMKDPDDLFDSNHSNWKPHRYGDPVDYNNPKTQQLIRDDYYIDRPLLIALVFEGTTEQVVIEKIFGLFMGDYEKKGYALYNAEGSANLGTKNLDGLIKLAKLHQMDVYLIIDNDSNAKSTLQHHKDLGNIREGMYTVWNKDFEYDNFGSDVVIEKVNRILEEKGYYKVSKEEVEHRMANEVLMRAIDGAVRKNNGGKKLDDIISKALLAEDLMAPRIEDIKREYAEDKWKPKLPIEKVIHSIFQRYPYSL